ncbi:hypothetical protein ACFPT6_25785, partial [Streptomyces cinereospinus]
RAVGRKESAGSKRRGTGSGEQAARSSPLKAVGAKPATGNRQPRAGGAEQSTEGKRRGTGGRQQAGVSRRWGAG